MLWEISRRMQNCVVCLVSRVVDSGQNILTFEIRIILEDFFE